MVDVYLGLGANLGDREASVRRAIALISETRVGSVSAVSRLVETEPVGGPPGQEPYLNAAVFVETELAPLDLLDALKSIERTLGRLERERWGSREIDLDILFYGDEVIETERLTVPHPLVEERGFVLVPLSEIAPELVHPVSGRTVREALAALEENAG